mmetsp:Transcript_26322/g.65418  ORF Transcript_26322/g.65418 Transcript_26322/m.65418 type:complete len:253 (-) Transcript_26322:144-902(-)
MCSTKHSPRVATPTSFPSEAARPTHTSVRQMLADASSAKVKSSQTQPLSFWRVLWCAGCAQADVDIWLPQAGIAPSLTTSSHDKKATQDLNLDGPVGGKTAGGPFATVTGAAAARASSLDDEIEEEIEADGEYDDEEFEPSDDGQIITRDDQPTDEGGRQADFDPTAAPPSHDQHTQDNDQPTAAASLPDRAAGPGQDGQPADGEDAAPSSDEDFGIITSGCDIEAESADFDAMVDEGEDVIDLDGRTAMTE